MFTGFSPDQSLALFRHYINASLPMIDLAGTLGIGAAWRIAPKVSLTIEHTLRKYVETYNPGLLHNAMRQTISAVAKALLPTYVRNRISIGAEFHHTEF